MAHILASLAVVLFVGCAQIKAEACTKDSIQACWDQELTDFCPYYQKITDCFNALDECPDAGLTRQLEYNIKGSTARAEQCPGHKEGECFASKLINCHAKIPYDVKFKEDLTEDAKKTLCAEFKGSEQKTKDCLDELKGQCTSEHAQKELDRDIGDLQDVMDICAAFGDE